MKLIKGATALLDGQLKKADILFDEKGISKIAENIKICCASKHLTEISAGKVVFKTTEEYTDFMDLSHFIKNCQYTRNSVK